MLKSRPVCTIVGPKVSYLLVWAALCLWGPGALAAPDPDFEATKTSLRNLIKEAPTHTLDLSSLEKAQESAKAASSCLETLSRLACLCVEQKSPPLENDLATLLKATAKCLQEVKDSPYRILSFTQFAALQKIDQKLKEDVEEKLRNPLHATPSPRLLWTIVKEDFWTGVTVKKGDTSLVIERGNLVSYRVCHPGTQALDIKDPEQKHLKNKLTDFFQARGIQDPTLQDLQELENVLASTLKQDSQKANLKSDDVKVGQHNLKIDGGNILSYRTGHQETLILDLRNPQNLHIKGKLLKFFKENDVPNPTDEDLQALEDILAKQHRQATKREIWTKPLSVAPTSKTSKDQATQHHWTAQALYEAFHNEDRYQNTPKQKEIKTIWTEDAVRFAIRSLALQQENPEEKPLKDALKEYFSDMNKRLDPDLQKRFNLLFVSTFNATGLLEVNDQILSFLNGEKLNTNGDLLPCPRPYLAVRDSFLIQLNKEFAKDPDTQPLISDPEISAATTFSDKVGKVLCSQGTQCEAQPRSDQVIIQEAFDAARGDEDLMSSFKMFYRLTSGHQHEGSPVKRQNCANLDITMRKAFHASHTPFPTRDQMEALERLLEQHLAQQKTKS